MMNRRDRLKWLPNINRVIHYLREYKDVLESCGAPGDDLLMDEEITELGSNHQRFGKIRNCERRNDRAKTDSEIMCLRPGFALVQPVSARDL